MKGDKMKKGFTLVELLAVIVILAIISLIAVPIVTDVINNSRESSILRSTEFYLDAVEQGIARRQLNNKTTDDGVYDVKEDGNICLVYDEEEECIDELKVEIDGNYPTGGDITISNGRISNIKNLKFGEEYVSYDENNEKIITDTPQTVAIIE